ncbi:PAS domain-containing sensor histidine kinase [Hymenobacter sp. 102]|uniref:PAS domain-containing sensor histidine kinase n=1 Tax=Hymenobacter sp. 102 TaxID=3403152 RepID=UPI003CE6EF12
MAAIASDSVTFAPEGLLLDVLAVSLTGVNVLRPLYDSAGQLADFALEYLNPAAQRMTGLPERPGGTISSRFPTLYSNGVFNLYRRVVETGQDEHCQVNYQADGFDNYFHVTARRSGTWLLVSFDDTSRQPRTPVEEALRLSQRAEQQARAEAERQRQRFEAVLLQLPACVAVYQGPNHVYQFVNPTYQQLFPHRRFIGQPLRAVVPEAEALGVVPLFDQVYQTGEPYYSHELEGWFDFGGHGQPEQIFLNLYLHPLRDAEGRIDGILGFSYDVNEQVRARRQVQQLNQELEARVAQRTRELTEQQRLFHQILTQVPASIATFSGPRHVFTYANASYQDLVRGRAEMGRSVAETLPDVAEQGIVDLLDHVYHSGQPVEGTETALLLTQSDGSTRLYHVNFSCQPLSDEQGRPRGLLVFIVDVTRHVRTRQQARALQACLLTAAQEQAAERLAFYHIFEQAPVLVALLRGAGHHFEYVNPAYQALFPERQLVGRPVAETVPEMQQQGFLELMDRTYQTSQTFVGREMPFTAQPLPGQPPRTIYYDFSYQAYRENGVVAGISIFAHDVTEQVRVRQQVERLNQELTTANADLHTSNAQLTRTNIDLDNFIYTASHDLKAPISNIEGLLLALEHELPPTSRPGDIPKILTLMQEATERFQRTIQHLTDISRLQQEHNQASEPVPLAAVVEAVRLDLLSLTQQSQARLTVQIAPAATVMFSERNLRSVVYNLLSNALKYAHPERPAQVSLRFYPQPPYQVLEVADNGLGLDLSKGRDKLFAMFQRLHTHVEGTGIGLYMVKKIVENAGGHIEVESQLNEGTVFRVYFRA